MGYRLYCDLCGKDIDNGEESRHFKVKEKKALFHDVWWEKIEAHDECVRAVINAVRERKDK